MPSDPPLTVRLADAADRRLLPAVEAASDRLLEPLGYWPLPQLPSHPEPVVAAFVAGRPPLGFVQVVIIDGHPHVAQVSVHPDHGRRGAGTALMNAVKAWAVAHGHDRITLTTFADIEFNAPWYGRLGYRETTADGPGLRATVLRERPLERLGRRVVMERWVWDHREDE